MTGRGWPDPREWVGDAPYPWPPANWLQPGETHTACYTIISTGIARAVDGSPVTQIDLADAQGDLSAWMPVDSGIEWLREGLYVGVRGIVTDAGGWNVLQLTEISPVRVSLDDLPLFLPHSSADVELLEAEFDRLADSIRHTGLRTLIGGLLGRDTEIGRGFRLAPAATRNHHACLGGLFEHTVSVARLCDFAAEHYGDAVDRDLLVAGALLHDIGKVREIGARAGFPYTDEGRLLGHILLGLQMIGSAAREIDLEPETRLLLEHLVASHQGRHEWQSPREPHVLEAFILHHLDDLDAKVDHVRSMLDTVDAGWTEYDRSLRRELLRHAPTVPTPAGAPGHSGKPQDRLTEDRVEHPAGQTVTPESARPAEDARRHHPEKPEAPPSETDERPEAEGSAPERPAPKRVKPASTKAAEAKAKAKGRKRSKKKTTRKKANGKKTAGKTAASNPARGKAVRKARKKNPGKSGPVQAATSQSIPSAPSPARAPRESGRPVIIEPGMPGFVDTDTLDLFEQD